MNGRTFALLLVTWIAFGSVFLAIKIGVGLMPPLLLGAARFLIAGAILYAIGLRLPNSEPDPIGRRQIWTSVAVGLSLAFVNGMVVLASTQMDSWLVSVLTCTIPLWSYGASVLFAHRPLQYAEASGVFFGIGGIVVLLWPGHETVHVDLALAILLIVGAMVWGGASVWERSAPIPKRSLVAIGLQCMVAGVAFVGWGAAAGEFAGLNAAVFFTPAALGTIAYLAVVATVLGYGAYMTLIVKTGATIANSFGYVSPAIAVLLGWAVLHEPVTMRTFAGFALIVLAVTLIVAPHPLRSTPPLPHRPHA
ncbi:MAG TPA: EamA family transporter [Candidatus Baltobacteraceae bacterium]|nr:EamA family transporter [Candidatus Baltobacteraceae bacterium]